MSFHPSTQAKKGVPFYDGPFRSRKENGIKSILASLFYVSGGIVRHQLSVYICFTYLKSQRFEKRSPTGNPLGKDNFCVDTGGH